MKVGSRKSAGPSKAQLKREAAEAAEDARRRWLLVLDDLSNRPNLERAQAETIARKALALLGETEERKQELEQRMVARFGPLAPVEVPTPAPEPAPSPAAPAPRPKMSQVAFDPRWLEPPLPTAPAGKPVSRRPRAKPAPKSYDIEKQLRVLMLRVGLDAAYGVIQDFKRRFAVE